MAGYRNILVYSLVNLGDVVLTTGAVALLRQAYPDAKITMMVRPAAAGVIVGNPLIDEALIYDYKKEHKGWKGMLRMINELRRRRFDLAVSFDRKLRPALLAWLAGIPARVGPDRIFDDTQSHVTWLYTRTIPIEHNLKETLQAESYQVLVRKLTGSEGWKNPVIAQLAPQYLGNVETVLKELPPADHKVALCVKGTFALKTWPAERFAAIVDQLAMRYPETVFFILGAPEDATQAQLVKRHANVPIFDFCGRTQVAEIAPLLKAADLMVTVDTGATHIAACVGLPMVVVYGCTSPKRWHPINPRAAVVTTEEECCPCSVPEDGCNHRSCLNKITVEMVLEKIEQVIDWKRQEDAK